MFGDVTGFWACGETHTPKPYTYERKKMESRNAIHLEYENSFVVFPQDTNYMPPMVFGGKMLSEMDIVAAIAARRFLYHSPTGARDAVTVTVNNVTFHKGAQVKDLVRLRATVYQAGVKSIDIQVAGYCEHGQNSNGDLIAERVCDGQFRFVAYDIAKQRAIPHGLKLPQ